MPSHPGLSVHTAAPVRARGGSTTRRLPCTHFFGEDAGGMAKATAAFSYTLVLLDSISSAI